MSENQEQLNIDQIVEARATQRMALTLGSVMLDKIRAEEEAKVLNSRIDQLNQQVDQLQNELDSLKPGNNSNSETVNQT